jgi:hypothetical protein
MSFSFLPLPPTFDHMDSDNWAELLDNIQSWLIESVDPSTPEWAWGWEVFWYVFIATNPDFPGGKWSFWDPSIFLEGQFIEEWVGSGGIVSMAIDDDSELATVSTHSDTLDYIWSEFLRHIALFIPILWFLLHEFSSIEHSGTFSMICRAPYCIMSTCLYLVYKSVCCSMTYYFMIMFSRGLQCEA